MSRVSRVGESVELSLTTTELELVRTIVEQLVQVMRDERDPATAGLYPDAYPDDREASAEFREFTRDDLRAGKLAHAATVLAGLAEGSPLRLAADDVEAWTRTLTDVRRVLAERLGITSDDDRPSGLMADVYAWAGELQWLLVDALDALDALGTDAPGTDAPGPGDPA